MAHSTKLTGRSRELLQRLVAMNRPRPKTTPGTHLHSASVSRYEAGIGQPIVTPINDRAASSNAPPVPARNPPATA